MGKPRQLCSEWTDSKAYWPSKTENHRNYGKIKEKWFYLALIGYNIN
jgi:hypothetical protein